MKYAIPKKRLFDAIYSFIDSNLKSDEFDWTYADDNDYAEGYDDNLVEFRGNSYSDGGEHYLLYIKTEYYEEMGGIPWHMEEFKQKSPLLEFNHRNPLWVQLDDIFGELWRPVFKKWFEDKYPEFPVKTYIF